MVVIRKYHFQKNSFSDIYKEDSNNIFFINQYILEELHKKTETSKNKAS